MGAVVLLANASGITSTFNMIVQAELLLGTIKRDAALCLTDNCTHWSIRPNVDTSNLIPNGEGDGNLNLDRTWIV
jgi:hypothetical protein